MAKMNVKNYFIKEGYTINSNPIPFFDNIKYAAIFQYDVYKYAQTLIEECNLKTVLDVGCGTGVKLKTLIQPVCNDITGIDTEHAIELCKSRFSFGTWIVIDIESNPTLQLNKGFDLIIVSDIIEHLKDPDILVTFIKRNAKKNTFILFSTPERDLARGKRSFGPPENVSHVREWNMKELNIYISNSGFTILKHFLVEDCKKRFYYPILKLFKNYNTCQVLLCKIK